MTTVFAPLSTFASNNSPGSNRRPSAPCPCHQARQHLDINAWIGGRFRRRTSGVDERVCSCRGSSPHIGVSSSLRCSGPRRVELDVNDLRMGVGSPTDPSLARRPVPNPSGTPPPLVDDHGTLNSAAAKDSSSGWLVNTYPPKRSMMPSWPLAWLKTRTATSGTATTAAARLVTEGKPRSSIAGAFRIGHGRVSFQQNFRRELAPQGGSPPVIRRTYPTHPGN